MSGSISMPPFLFASRTTTMSCAIDLGLGFDRIARFVELIFRIFLLVLAAPLFCRFGESTCNELGKYIGEANGNINKYCSTYHLIYPYTKHKVGRSLSKH